MHHGNTCAAPRTHAKIDYYYNLKGTRALRPRETSAAANSSHLSPSDWLEEPTGKHSFPKDAASSPDPNSIHTLVNEFVIHLRFFSDIPGPI